MSRPEGTSPGRKAQHRGSGGAGDSKPKLLRGGAGPRVPEPPEPGPGSRALSQPAPWAPHHTAQAHRPELGAQGECRWVWPGLHPPEHPPQGDRSLALLPSLPHLRDGAVLGNLVLP